MGDGDFIVVESSVFCATKKSPAACRETYCRLIPWIARREQLTYSSSGSPSPRTSSFRNLCDLGHQTRVIAFRPILHHSRMLSRRDSTEKTSVLRNRFDSVRICDTCCGRCANVPGRDFFANCEFHECSVPRNNLTSDAGCRLGTGTPGLRFMSTTPWRFGN